MTRTHTALAAVLAIFLLASGCRPDWSRQLQRMETLEDVYRATLRQYERGKWENAIAGFERLSTQLPARDTLLPRTYYFLGMAHSRRGEHLLAAQTFQRLPDAFPNDSLADDALLLAARAYSALWRRPALDPEYGFVAVTTLQTMLALYPTSDRHAEAERELAELQESLARKDLENGIYYLRRRSPHSAIIYFTDVIERFPTTPAAREAYMQLVGTYRSINYREDAREACESLLRAYPGDPEAIALCGPGQSVSAPPP